MILKSSLRNLIALSVAALSLSGIAATAQTSAIQPLAPAKAKVAPNYGKLPLHFEPNRGQVDPSVQFLARGSHYSVMLQPSAATLVLNHDAATPQQPRRHGQPPTTTSAAIRMTLEGANAKAAMSPERELPGYVNYLSGEKAQTHTGIPTYAAARATGVYPGIDLVYYGTERQLEYDFVVSPQSDPGMIHLSIAGAHPVLQANGELRLQLASRQRDNDILFRKPVLYQQIDGKQQPVDGSFTIAANGEVGFHIGNYDHARELVIDPVISYASYFGGSAEDEINGSALNSANQLYAVGQTVSTSLMGTSGEFESGPYGGVQVSFDGFVTKFSADGSSVLWTTYLVGSGHDYAIGVAVNSADQAYVVGNTDSCITPSEAEPNQNYDPNAAVPIVRFPFTADAVQTLCSPNVSPYGAYESDGTNTTTFLVKLSSDGKTELYGTPIGGSSGDYASSIVLDATGRPYIVGETTSTAYSKCATVGPHCSDVPSYPVDQHGNADIGLANYPTTSNAFYSSTAESQMFPSNCTGCAPTQDEQAFITILSADLHSFVYSSLIGGPVIGGCGNGACNTNGIAVAVNAAGQAFIGGNTSSAHWPTTAGAFATTCSNAGNANSQCPMTGWLAGFDPTKSGAASLLFATYMNGSSAGLNGGGTVNYPGSDVYGLATDSKGNVVVTGDTSADNFPTTAGTFEPACVQFSDGNANTKRCQSAYITKLSPTGATVWSTYYTPLTNPGNGVVGQGVALDANDNVFVVGTSTSPTLPLVQTLSTNGAQSNDAFVIELSPTGSSLLMGTYLGTGGGITLNNNSLHLDSNLNAYFTGNQGYNPYGGTSFPVSSNAPQKNIQGNDGWVVKLITQQQVSTTALQVTPNAGGPGTSISFTATVTGLPAFATPTGTVTLTSGTTTLGTITLANGTGTFSTTSLAAGTYSVIATYLGDVVYTTSVSTAQAVSIQNTPTVALTATPSTTTIGTAVALKATVSSAAGTPTGTVYFLDGTTTLGSAVLSGGTASYSAAALAVGSHAITARYGGDSNFVTVTSTAQTVTITLITPNVVLTATPATATVGTAVALGASVAGTGAAPTGSVIFLDGTTTLATVNLASGAASYSTAALTVGTHTITAKYNGDSNYAALTTTPQTVTINPLPPTLMAAFSPSTLTIVHGSVGTSTLTLTPANGFAGTLTFSCGTLPGSASCGFSPTSLTFTAASSAPQSTTLSVSTTSAIIGLLQPVPANPSLHGGLNGIALAGLLLLPMAFSRRVRRAIRSRSVPVLALTLFALLVTAGFSGCSSGSSTPSATTTTPGAYTVSVTVSGAPSSTTVNLQVNVQ
jgi:hypothetical protein